MKTDTTLHDIYDELGLLDIMQSTEAEQFIDEVCDFAADDMSDVKAA